MSALAGVHVEALDTDPETMVTLAVNRVVSSGARLLAVVPFVSAAGRPGYLVVSQDGQ
ncbi:MAG: hypothetical protein AB7H88_21605 [Vicinamibacterales bacterium]